MIRRSVALSLTIRRKKKLVQVGFNKMPLWQDAVKKYLIEIKG